MATLQKFKLLATQCAIAGSPSRSPSTSPVIHLRRRKTLRMLLSRRLPHRDEILDRRSKAVDTSLNRKAAGVRQKLKDLLVSSPRLLEENGSDDGGEAKTWSVGGGLIVRRGGFRPLSATLRQRLLRRLWRPVLVTIPE